MTNQVKTWNAIYCIYRYSLRIVLLAAKCPITKSLKLWIVLISSLWGDKTAEEFSLSRPIRFRENVLMRFKVLKQLSESAEDIAVVKIMLKNCDAAGNVLVREIFQRI